MRAFSTGRRIALFAVLGAVSCRQLVGIEDQPAPRGVTDAGPDAGYAELGDLSHWAAFDIATIDPAAVGFATPVSDGRYLYYPPSLDGVTAFSANRFAARYDTTRALTDASSWSLFDLRARGGATRSGPYLSAAYDGRFVHFAGVGGSGVARLDTQQDFQAANAWTFYALPDAPADSSYFTVLSDAPYLYFAPTYGGAIAERLDTRGDPNAAASWASFDQVTASANALAYKGAVRGGRYVYFAPVSGSDFLRYDTKGAFDSPASWTAVAAKSLGFEGIATESVTFDGDYVYFGAGFAPTAGGGYVIGSKYLRYDTHLGFDLTGAWSVFDVTSAGAPNGANVTAFDGRFVYFDAPTLIARYDTHAAYGLPSSWTMFDKTLVHRRTGNGMLFDTRAMYSGPGPARSVALRFDPRP